MSCTSTKHKTKTHKTKPNQPKTHTQKTYEAPCSRSKARTGRNFVTTFSLRTEEDKAKWTLCGVALLCSID